MKTINIVLVLICIILIGIIAWMWKRPVDVVTEIVTDTVYVETTVYDTVYPTPITLVETVYDTIVTTEDYSDIGDMMTESVLAEFYATKFYDDTLKDDSDGYVRIQSKIRENSLVDRKLFYESRYKSPVITQYVTQKDWGLYFMATLMAGKQASGFSGSLIYKDYNSRLFSLEIGYMGNTYVGIGYGFRF